MTKISVLTLPINPEAFKIQTYSGFEQEVKYAQELIQQQLANGTKRVSNSDWVIFTEWCNTRGFIAESATHEAVTIFLASQYEQLANTGVLMCYKVSA